MRVIENVLKESKSQKDKELDKYNLQLNFL